MIKAKHSNINVREGKQYTTKPNRLGTCIWKPVGKPEENQDEVAKTEYRPDPQLWIMEGENTKTQYKKTHSHISESTYIFRGGQFKYYKRTEHCK